jgi:hypothetical protein
VAAFLEFKESVCTHPYTISPSAIRPAQKQFGRKMNRLSVPHGIMIVDVAGGAYFTRQGLYPKDRKNWTWGYATLFNWIKEPEQCREQLEALLWGGENAPVISQLSL